VIGEANLSLELYL